jgi:hypothetical protein
MHAKSSPVRFPVAPAAIDRPKLYIRFVSLPLPVISLNIRKDLLICRLMVTGGLSIPALMLFDILPVSFLLGFLALALIAVGGVMFLIRCGEVA